MSKFHSQTAQFVATVAQNLPEMSGDIMQGWIENPKGLQKFLMGLCLSANGCVPEFKVFKTLKLRTGMDAKGYRKAIEEKKMRIGYCADDILGKPAFSVATEEMELDLVVVSVKELTGKDEAPLIEIYARAKERGLGLCPNEVGPSLRLQYADQPNGEWLIIGMEPIADSDGYLELFYLEHSDDGLWLYTRYGRPGSVWRGCYRFVFVRPRK